MIILTDLDFILLGLEFGFGTSLVEPVQSDADVIWFDTNPVPMLRALYDRLQPSGE